MNRWLPVALLFLSPVAALPRAMCHPEIMVEWLYLRPSTCDLDFVICDERPFNPNTTPQSIPSGRAFSIRPDFDGGVRAALGFTLGCWQLRFLYTYLSTHERRAFDPKEMGAQWPTIVHPRYTDGNPLFDPLAANEIAGLSTGKGSSDYQVLQVELGRNFHPKCRLDLRPYGALQLAYTGNTLQAFYRGTEMPGEAGARLYRSTAEWNKWCWGAGPLFGVDLRYCLGYGFGVGGHLHMGLMAGQTHGDIQQRIQIEQTGGIVDVDQNLNVLRRYRLLVFPFFERKIGLNYLLCCGDQFTLLIEFGYDFISYINSLERFRFNDQRATGSSTCHSFSLDGVYLLFKLQL